MKVLELFSGIGGCAAALGEQARVVAAVDQKEQAQETYKRNFPTHPRFRWNIVGLKADQVRRLEADLWWMSPPCQPFTERGQQRDLDDPRCGALIRLISLVGELRPRWLALENVAPFGGSRAHELLEGKLAEAGYQVRSLVLCSSELGVPNRRKRFYLVAGRDGLPDAAGRPPDAVPLSPLADYLDPSPSSSLYLSEELQERYREALSVVEASVLGPIPCFTSAYGRSPVHAGPYLRDRSGLRHFSPEEILRLLHFPEAFSFPVELPVGKRWPLVGNSLSVLSVRSLLEPILDSDRSSMGSGL